MAIRVVKNQHVGWNSHGVPINEYVFAVSKASELPSSPYTDTDGSRHVIAHGSRGWAIQEKQVYGYDDGTWELQFTMNG